MSRLLLTIGVLVVLAVPTAWADEPTAVEIAWLKEHVVAVKTAEAGSGFEDLMPLKEMIGDARIVALGEATHGTREFFQMKHRLIEFLASEMGFTIFSIEANMPEAYRVNDFVLRGEGDPKELLAGMYFWTWNTQEVLDLILWMRELNKSGGGELQFTGFDMQTPNVAMQIVQDFVAKVEPGYSATVAKTYTAAKTATRATAGATFGVATATFPRAAAAGKKIRFGGQIKTEGVTGGFAGLWWRVDGESGVLAFDNMSDRGPRGTTSWKRYEIELDVPAEITNINFGVLLTGEGTAWFDELAVEVDGEPFEHADLFDFGFESGRPRGFFTAGEGYRVQIDDSEAHQGRRSLRMQRQPTSQPSSSSAAEAAQRCGEVVKHLKVARDDYRREAGAEEIEWAIQNARVVTQTYRMHAGQTSRDESMALNVRWILKQAPPDAKIILWAHNGHVRKDAAKLARFRTMGAHLKKAFGDDLFVLGFTCNTGEYTAIKPEVGLQVNDLQPAEPGTAEYYFHKTGLPRLILDLRAASKDVPASAWLTRPIKLRSIGALAMDQQFFVTTLPESYDALVYFDETSASRPVGR